MFRNVKKKISKNFNWKKKSKIKKFQLPQFHFYPLHPYMPKSTNNFEKKFTCPDRFQRVDLVLRISKNLGVKSRNGTNQNS